LRDRLVAELSDLKSADEAADWVHKNLAAKNTLTRVDAETVEASFQERLAAIEGGKVSATVANDSDTAANEIAIPGDEAHPALGQALQQKPFACVIRSTANSSLRSPASSAAARPPKRITFALLNRARSTAKSATSTQFQSAAFITASCTDMAMKPRGGLG
jgi:hypothetical protein